MALQEGFRSQVQAWLLRSKLCGAANSPPGPAVHQPLPPQQGSNEKGRPAPRPPASISWGVWGGSPHSGQHLPLLTLTLTLPAVLLVCLQGSLPQGSGSSKILLQIKAHVNYQRGGSPHFTFGTSFVVSSLFPLVSSLCKVEKAKTWNQDFNPSISPYQL